METQVTILTHDQFYVIVASYSPGYYRFTIRPYNSESEISNTRHYAFAGEAVTALQNKGYDYAQGLINEALNQLPKLKLLEQLV